jgi:hypothetical protein
LPFQRDLSTWIAFTIILFLSVLSRTEGDGEEIGKPLPSGERSAEGRVRARERIAIILMKPWHVDHPNPLPKGKGI